MFEDSSGKEQSERGAEVIEDDNLDSNDEGEIMEEADDEYDPVYEGENANIEDDEEELIEEDSELVFPIFL